jgi:hypothetical protein
MNEIFKQNTARKVLAAMEGYKNRTGKNITALDLCHRLGIKHVAYITKMKKKETHNQVPPAAWEAFRNFVNSGSRLEDYNIHEIERAPAKGGIIPGAKTPDDELHPSHEAIDALQGGGSTNEILPNGDIKLTDLEIKPAEKEPSPIIKEIIKDGTPLNKKVLALIDSEPGQDPVCKLCFEVDFKITINGRPI